MKEIIHERQSDVFERIVRDKFGRVFVVRFVVVEKLGIIKGRIISCEQIKRADCQTRFLCGESGKSASSRDIVIEFLNSPYFSKFDFLTSIKIRAPNFR